MILRNEKGVGGLIVIVLMVLVLLTIIGIASVNMSNTEAKISVNNLIHHMEFYGADSAFGYGSMWAEQNITPDDVGKSFDLDPITFSNSVTFTTHIECLSNVEPISGMPDIKITGTGTHPRKGIVVLEQIWRYVPAFQSPGAPIRSWSAALTIQGNPEIDSGYNLCDGETAPPEVRYDLDMGGPIDFETSVDCPAGDGTCNAEVSSPPILWGNLRQNILDLAKIKTEPDANGKLSADFGTADDPTVVYVDASVAPVEIQGGDGYGILFIDGDVDTISGGFDWHGLVVINGKVNNKITGTAEIWGALFLNNEESTLLDEDEDLFGNLKVRYDCEALNMLYNNISGYKPTPTWRYVH